MNPPAPPGRPEDDHRGESSPSGPQKALVRCDGFRCLAFRDADGTWKDAHDRPLKVIEVLQEL